jgi:hypothetical protein
MLVRTWRVRSKASQSRAPSASSSANHKKPQPYGPIRPLLCVSCRSVVDLLAPHCRSTIAWEDFETTLDSCRQATLKLLLGNADGPLTIAELHRRVFAAAGCVSALRVCSDRQLSGTAASTSGGR